MLDTIVVMLNLRINEVSIVDSVISWRLGFLMCLTYIRLFEKLTLAANWHTIYSMWKIYEHKRVEKQLRSCPTEVQKRYEKWKDVVAISGSQGLLLIKGFSDEALKGEWNGYRSSRLNKQYRVIYLIKADEVYVQVEQVTPHDYRRK